MVIDILLLLFVLSGFWLGYVRGIIRTLIMIVAYITAILITLKISPWLAGFLSSSFNISKISALIFGTIFFFLLLLFLIHFVAKKVSQSAKKGNLTTANKIFGGLIMAGLALLFYSMLLWPINQFGMIGVKAKHSSKSYSLLVSIPDKSKTFIEKFKPIFSRYWQLMEESIDENKSDNPQ